MIIVNQREDIIINFTNVISIYVKEKDVQVLMNCIEDALILGKYATEKRAKEVLQEIIKAYIESKKAQEATSMFGFSIVPSNTYYEMPKE